MVSNYDYELRHPYDELYDLVIRHDGNLVFVDLLVEYVTHRTVSEEKLKLLSEENRQVFFNLTCKY